MDGYHGNFVHQSYFENIRRRTGVNLTDMMTSQSLAQTRDLGNGHVSLIMCSTSNLDIARSPSLAFASKAGVSAEQGQSLSERNDTRSGVEQWHTTC